MTGRPIRVRFAPSPTGPMHIGGVRTALYNFLFARKHNGRFILRMEDTDQSRFIPGAEEYILESLRWCGLETDEDIIQGGPYAPYRQSERTAIYHEFIHRLLDRGHAYYAFDTPEELETIRRQFRQSGHYQFQYCSSTRQGLQNSLSLSPGEVARRINRGDPYVIRILIPDNESVIFHDLIRGEVQVDSSFLDDKVLFKSDGLPTYHLANVVDDYLMKITHVIRGEEWLPSAPMHLLLYRFFGWESEMPSFAHLPLILKPDGNGKLSKRDADRLGFPVFPLEWKDPLTGEVSKGYREEGYLADAMINLLALLGWNPGTEQEIFSIQELIAAFSLDRVHKSGSRFDPEKAKWFNHQYLISRTDDALAQLLIGQATGSLASSNRNLSLPDSTLLPWGTSEPRHDLSDPAYARKVVSLIKDRATLIPDLWANGWFFYYIPASYDPQMIMKTWKPDTSSLIQAFLSDLSELADWNRESIHRLIQDFTTRQSVTPGQLMTPLRVLIVGSNRGPGLTEIAEVMGKQDFLSRISTGLKKIQEKTC